MIVGALVWDPASRARLQEATRSQAHLHLCERQSELLALVQNGLADVVVLDMRDAEGESTLSTVVRIREGFPSVPVVLYFALSPSISRDMLAFARAGVNDLVLRDVDDVKVTLRASLTSAADHCSARTIATELEPLVPPNVAPIIRYCLENGRRALTVEDVASALNVHRKTLVDRLSAAGLPAPSAIIAWCRLMISARLLEDPGRTIEQVALLLDFPSGTSMRNMVKRYTGLRTGEVRQNGGLRCVMHAFKREIAQVAGRPRA
ncbi:MAG: helix-turn-helix domain-containing protein [Gemmatimonadaceae bacterium]|nr:helix-turn-helix domain-containing protein [Gemmatimonadaceae bacterium]